MKGLTDVYTMYNGVTIPCVGYGTWQTPDGDVARESTKEAIIAGYRHIDTAQAYHNEQSVGDGIKEGLAAAGLKREDIFITTKLWCDRKDYEDTKAAVRESIEKLGCEYLDLLLIHWPISTPHKDCWQEKNRDAWRAMEDLYKEGVLRAIGLSNFYVHHIDALNYTVKPMVNQIEIHPGYIQKELVEYCKANDIVVEAWSPLGSGAVLNNEFLKGIAQKYNKSVAQLCIRFCLQYGVLPMPKSVHKDRIIQNTEVFDFEISNEDMEAIMNMEQTGWSGLQPDGKLPF
ncbi:aldo/keto reductase [Anaerolentibacter hominis]|uniref:aldo/keto reductase n=1 Tax=Anaerolentibacter hominis TaxID=3079009 RepID=UPI0031B8143D